VAEDAAVGPSPQSIARPTTGSRLRLSKVAGREPGLGFIGPFFPEL
jgi:hypothetical protein